MSGPLEGERPKRPAPLTEWRHWKGGRYMVLTLARHHARSREWWVIYRAIDANGETWARPIEEWEAMVNQPGGSPPVPRFGLA